MPLALECPAGKLTGARVPFGKISLAQTGADAVQLEADTTATELQLETTAASVQARINGVAAETLCAAPGHWTIRSQPSAP